MKRRRRTRIEITRARLMVQQAQSECNPVRRAALLNCCADRLATMASQERRTAEREAVQQGAAACRMQATRALNLHDKGQW